MRCAVRLTRRTTRRCAFTTIASTSRSKQLVPKRFCGSGGNPAGNSLWVVALNPVVSVTSGSGTKFVTASCGRKARLRHGLAVLSWTVWLTAASLAQSVVPSPRVIDAENAGSLKPIFSFRIPRPEGLSGSVVVAGSILFLQSPFPHVIFALDLMRPDDPIRWSFAPPARPEAAGLDWYGATTAGPVLTGDRLFL